ncbi:NAD-dependent epimerase/dehydratase family protein [Falsiroseomonas oryzae]|uniref:NAD-dependent epimerase/dehydratase family protein n=1 Tax=Falsiroseomonas oryzae TaxID=2766473 RepID=UPI0022EB1083|nr:NAD-dependent epimerase/dehydratase family protein [Roseomonas sp. MO-31]
MPRALVTGANGFLGLNLVEQLCAADWQVDALVQPGTDTALLGRFPVQVVTASITDAGSLSAAIRPRLDTLFHLAASTSVWRRRNAEQVQVNVEGTRNVARAALIAGARRLVATSTWNTYGLGRAEISEASDQRGGASGIGYVRTKYLAEEELRAAGRNGLDVVILNPGHMIGRYDTRNWGRIIRMVDTGTLPGVPRLRGSFCHGAAVAAAHIAAAERGRPGCNYLLPGVEASFAEIIGRVAELLGRPVPTRTIPTWLLMLMARAKVLRAAITGQEPDLTPDGVALMANDPRITSDRAHRELGYDPVPLGEMLEDACFWLRDQGLLQSLRPGGG